MTTTHDIDQIMERASQELVEMAYAACERSCLEALALAHTTAEWDRFARILLPLQEARRQRRQIAEDAGVVVLHEHMTAEAILDEHDAGCLLLLSPLYAEADAKALTALALEKGAMVQVLWLDAAGQRAAFLNALEDRGDAALAELAGVEDQREKLDALYEQLDSIGDHEIAHQRLAKLARSLAKKT